MTEYYALTPAHCYVSFYVNYSLKQTEIVPLQSLSLLKSLNTPEFYWLKSQLPLFS